MLIKTKLDRIGLFTILGLMVTTSLTDILANLFGGKEIITLVGDLIYIPLTISLVTLSAIQAFTFGKNNIIGIATILFLVFAILWWTAENTRIIEELIIHEKPFPSVSDIFYILGYPFLILAEFRYLKIIKNHISQKIMVTSCLVSVSLVIPSLYLDITSKAGMTSLVLGIVVFYPVLDGLAIIPAIIGFFSFLGGEVCLLWLLFSIAIFTVVGGDTAVLITNTRNLYYTGHPIEILFYWSYILFSYAVYSHIRVFKTEKKKFYDKEGMR